MAALENLTFKNWSVSDKVNTLNGNLWNGAIGFSVFPKDRSAGSKALLKINLDQAGHGYAGLMQMIAELQKSPLGTKIPMSKTQFNPQTRTRSNQWIITLEKDADMIYKITLTDCTTNATFTFPIIASQSILIGSEPADKAKQSSMGMMIFKNWLEQAFRYAPATANKPQFGGQRPGGQGGAPRPGFTPAAAAPAPSVASDPEDVPF